MHTRTKSAVLWGLVGALSFLVLLQGYEVIVDASTPLVITAAVTVVIGVLAAGLSYVVEGRLRFDDAKGHR